MATQEFTATPKADAFIDAGPVMSELVSDYDRTKMLELLTMFRENEQNGSDLLLALNRAASALAVIANNASEYNHSYISTFAREAFKECRLAAKLDG